MSLTLSLKTALSGLQLSQAAMSATSNNVSNANTPGYTRKSVEPIARTVAGAGAGVQLGELRRSVDERLIREVREANAMLGTYTIKAGYMDRVQNLFGKPGDNSSIANRIDEFAAAVAGLSSTPESATERINMINEAQKVAQQLNDMSEAVQRMRLDADAEINQAVGVINEQLETIVRLNAEIAQIKGQGQPAVELEDERDNALDTISEYMEINYFQRSTGEIVVYTPEGTVLADSVAKTFTYNPAAVMSPTISYGAGISGINAGAIDLTDRIEEGRLAGLIAMRDTELPELQAELDRLTEQLRDQINAIHNQGTGNPAANTLNGQRTFGDITVDNIVVDEPVRFTVVDADGRTVTSALMPADTYSAEEVQDWVNANLPGATATVSNGNGLQITATDPTHGIALVDSPNQSISDGTVTVESLSHYFGLNDFFVTNGNVTGDAITGISQILEVRSDIASDPHLISRGRLDINAATAGDIAIAAGDNSIITALAEKFDEELLIPASGGLPQSRTTLSGYGADILANAAMEASSASTKQSFQNTLSQEMEFRRSGVSGVNVDEEMANLILYQNAYSASARVIDVARQMFDTLESIMR